MRIRDLIIALQKLDPNGEVYVVFNGKAIGLMSYNIDCLTEVIESGSDQPELVFVNDPNNPDAASDTDKE